MSSRPGAHLAQSPLWTGLLERAEAAIATAERPAHGSATTAKRAAASAVARGHGTLLVVLGGDSRPSSDLASELIEDAVEVILRAAAVAEIVARSEGDHRAEFVDYLRGRLSAREEGVLAGEMTYRLLAGEGDERALRVRRALAAIPERRTSDGRLSSLRIGAAELAALLIRAAANAAVGGGADEAPEDRSPELDAALDAIVDELAAAAQDVEPPIDERADVVAHHLAAGLRVRVSHETLGALSSATPGGGADPTLPSAARAAWLRLATCEYVAAKALDDQLDSPAYDERFADLRTAITEGAANVVCGARLGSRPTAFRHPQAWAHQSVALTFALEAYVAGLRGHAPSFAQTELITLTRLARAVAAIALLDMPRAGFPPGNGSSKH